MKPRGFIKIHNRRLNINHITRYELWWPETRVKIKTTDDMNVVNDSHWKYGKVQFPHLLIYMCEHPEYEPIKVVIGRSIDDYLKIKYGYVRNFNSIRDDVYDRDKIQEYIWYRSDIGRRVVKYLDKRFL